MHVVADAGTSVPLNPRGDIEAINMELILAELEMVNRRIEKAAKGDKKFLHEVEVFQNLAAHLDNGKYAWTYDCSQEDASIIAASNLLSLKPVIYAANTDEDGFPALSDNRCYQQVQSIAVAENAQVLPICAKLESEVTELEGEERHLFLEDLGIQESGLDRLIKCSYALPGLISFLACGKDECRAWTIRKGTKAPGAAGKIHTDIQRGFIRAEVIACEDMVRCGSGAAAKEKGLLRSEGKEYVVQDGDMIYFRFKVRYVFCWTGMIFNIRRTPFAISVIVLPHSGHANSSSLRRCSTASTDTFSRRRSAALASGFFRVCLATVVFCFISPSAGRPAPR